MSECKWYKDFRTYDEDGPLQSAEFSGEIYDQDGNYVASCGEAYSDLIAAAPDMLEALNFAEQFIVTGVEFWRFPMPGITLSKIVSAIKKAKGEQQ